MNKSLSAYLDLLRVHFFFVWPTLFSAGLFLGFQLYNNFSITLILQAILIGFFGFEAGLVLNDIVDANYDKKEVEVDKLTKYWRPFGKRPISQGLISTKKATIVFALLVALTSILIFTLPYPNSIYVFSVMLICYSLEVFYQIKKRNEKLPIAQIIGRVDFALFLVAGYLCVGNLDMNALYLFLFFYPLALAHLGVNDLVDILNDKAKQLNTIPTLYGMKATAYWVLIFSLLHFAMAVIFLTLISYWAIIGFTVSFTLISLANILILRRTTPESSLKALPLFHVAMLIYAITTIAACLIPTFL